MPPADDATSWKVDSYTESWHHHILEWGIFQCCFIWHLWVWRWQDGWVWKVYWFRVIDFWAYWVNLVVSFRISWWLLSSWYVCWCPSWRYHKHLCLATRKLDNTSITTTPWSRNLHSGTSFWLLRFLVSIFAPSSYIWVCSCNLGQIAVAWDGWSDPYFAVWPFLLIFQEIPHFF